MKTKWFIRPFGITLLILLNLFSFLYCSASIIFAGSINFPLTNTGLLIINIIRTIFYGLTAYGFIKARR
ncbi:MAG: hypothetical protein V1703_03625, partial [Candidatus Altiarchaeota archaeon]